MKILILVFLAFMLIPVIDTFGHGPNGIDRAPPIDFDQRKVTVIGKMSPSDMTLGDFSNAFLEIRFVELDKNSVSEESKCRQNFVCNYDTVIKQVTYAVDIKKGDKLLAREMFYAEDGIITIDIRPNEKCSIQEENPWKCSKYYGVEHPIAGGLYTFGLNNPVIDGPIFTQGGLYHVTVKVLGAESPRSNFEPLVFDLYVSIAQEQTFYIDVPDYLLT